MAKQEEKISFDLPLEEYSILEKTAKEKHSTPDKVLSKIIREHAAEDKAEEFEENGVVYERVKIPIPKAVVDFYRFIAHARGNDGVAPDLMAIEIVKSLDGDIQSPDPAKVKEWFNLDAAFNDVAEREKKLMALTETE